MGEQVTADKILNQPFHLAHNAGEHSHNHIDVAFHEHHGVPNQRQLDCLCDSFWNWQQIDHQRSTLSAFCEGDQWFPPTRGQ